MGGGGEGEVLHRPSPSPLFGHPASTHVFGRADRRPPCGRMILNGDHSHVTGFDGPVLGYPAAHGPTP